MALDPDAFYAHALEAADAEQRLPLSRMTMWDVAPFAPNILEQDELGDDVAVARRRLGGDGSGLRERPGDAIQRFVGQFFGRRTIPPIEVGHQAPAHFEIAFTVRVDAIIEPREQARECELRNCWFFS